MSADRDPQHDFADDDPAWRHWPARVLEHLEWLQHSPLGLQLTEWLQLPRKYQVVLGRDGYRAAMLALLHRAQRADCQAAGFRFDPATPDWGHFSNDELNIQCQWSSAGHRSLLWSEPGWPGAWLWIDAERVRWSTSHPDAHSAPTGRWVDEHRFAVEIAGPEDHPQQQLAMGSWLGTVLGLLVVDARARRQAVLQPLPHENWSWPWIVKHDSQWRVYPTPEAFDKGLLPDRTLAEQDLFR
jgi:hypothetical protein